MQQQYPGALKEVEANRGQFTIVFVGILAATFAILAVTGMTPDTTADAASTATTADSTQSQQVATITGQEEPVRVVASNIKLDATVSNPTTTDPDALDPYLLKGAVHYATSAPLGVNGTVVLFGHSSYLPVVGNLAYKTFDGIQNLKSGDIVSVYSATKEYRYSVTSVKQEDTSDVVPLNSDGKYLTLITCDSFGETSDRFVVTADFVGAYSLTQ